MSSTVNRMPCRASSSAISSSVSEIARRNGATDVRLAADIEREAGQVHALPDRGGDEPLGRGAVGAELGREVDVRVRVVDGEPEQHGAVRGQVPGLQQLDVVVHDERPHAGGRRGEALGGVAIGMLKMMRCRPTPRFQHLAQLRLARDVEPAVLLGEGREHGRVVQGLHRVVQPHPRQRVAQGSVPLPHHARVEDEHGAARAVVGGGEVRARVPLGELPPPQLPHGRGDGLRRRGGRHRVGVRRDARRAPTGELGEAVGRGRTDVEEHVRRDLAGDEPDGRVREQRDADEEQCGARQEGVEELDRPELGDPEPHGAGEQAPAAVRDHAALLEQDQRECDGVEADRLGDRAGDGRAEHRAGPLQREQAGGQQEDGPRDSQGR